MRAPLHSLSHFHATPSALAALLVSGIHNWRLSSSSLLALSLNLYKCMWRKKRNTKFTIKKKHTKRKKTENVLRVIYQIAPCCPNPFFFFFCLNLKTENKSLSVCISLHCLSGGFFPINHEKCSQFPSFLSGVFLYRLFVCQCNVMTYTVYCTLLCLKKLFKEENRCVSKKNWNSGLSVEFLSLNYSL